MYVDELLVNMRQRIPLRDVPALAFAFLTFGLLLFSSTASAALVTIVPPYAGVTVTASPTTWASGIGSLTWTPPATASLATGDAAADPHAGAGPGAGHYGTHFTLAGFNVTYVCAGACTTGIHSLRFHWSLSFFQAARVTSGCTGTPITGYATAGLWVVGIMLTSSGTTVNSKTLNISFLNQVGVGALSAGPNSSVSATVGFNAAFAAGATYYFISYLQQQSEAFCPGPGTQGGTAFAESDTANFGTTLLSGITIA